MNEPFRVLHIFGRLDTGGAENLIMSVYRHIDREKVRFDFAVHTNNECHYEPEITALGGHIFHGLPRYRVFNYLAYKKAWRLFFTSHKYDTVHIHTTNSAAPILLVAKRHGINTRILHAHNSDEETWLRRIHVRLLRPLLRHYGTHFIAVSDKAGEFIFKTGYTVKKNAIDAERFRFDTAVRQQIRLDMGWSDDFVICHVGRFHPQKNHSFLLDVFRELTARMPNARLILIGEGELRPVVESEILKYNLKVSMLGVRDDVPALLSAADAFVLPSRYEGLGIAAVEAQAAGLQTFLSDIIPKEARIINDLVVYLPIDTGTLPWVNALIAEAGVRRQRPDTFEEIRKAGYDIIEAARWYKDFYLSAAGKR